MTTPADAPRATPDRAAPDDAAPDRAPDRQANSRLGRAVAGRGQSDGRAVGPSRPVPRRGHREPHRRGNWLRDVILGGQDGLVNILGIILGVTAASGSTTVLIVTGIAAAITESISMGAVGYTSSVSERDFYEAERARERQEVETEPEIEEAEVREIYASKGFSGELLDRVVETIVANRDRWVETMMDEELHLQPVETADILRTSVVITIATLIGHLIPLAPFFLLDRTAALVAAFVLSAIVLFSVGAYAALTLIGDWRRSGIQMLLIGLGAAIAGYLISTLIGVVGAAR